MFTQSLRNPQPLSRVGEVRSSRGTPLLLGEAAPHTFTLGLALVKVLVVGSGGREHALVYALHSDPAVTQIYAAPGNPGIAELAACVALDGGPGNQVGLRSVADELKPDIIIIGPEAPLVDGVADVLRADGFTVFGPSGGAAALEGSKAFAKGVMAEAGVPTAGALVCSTLAEVDAALAAFGAPHVVKDDGLAAGKGVVVTDDVSEAREHAAACLSTGGGKVVIEEFLDGEEVSLFVVCDGVDAVALLPAQDFKRIGEGDTGPNTGGMGAYAPLDWAPADLSETVVQQVALPTLAEMARRGTPFSGVLFVGLALTSRGPRVIEFNVRFGDPETLSVLALLRTPISEVLLAAATGSLADLPPLRWADGYAVTVVVAAQGYPQAPRTGDAITGLDAAAQHARVHHAGTQLTGSGDLVSAGGRVVSVTGTGASLAQARAAAYTGVGEIGLDGAQARRDVAERAEQAEQAGK